MDIHISLGNELSRHTPHVPPAAANDTADPDARLLAAWHEYRRLFLLCEDEHLDERLAEQYSDQADACLALIGKIPAGTLAGLSIKLRHAYLEVCQPPAIEWKILVAGEPLRKAAGRPSNPDDDLVLWNVIVDVQEMGA